MIKIKLISVLTSVMIFLPNLLSAQDDGKACQLILQAGLYKQYKIVKQGSFAEDLKEYFSHKTFTEDYHEGRWAGKIAVVYDGFPIELGANSLDKDLDIFQQTIRQSKELKITQGFYDYSSISIPDVELAKVYSDCVNERRFGFKITPKIGDKDVFFVINYFKSPNEKDGMPKIIRFELKGASNIIKSFKIGDKINTETSITADRDPEKDLRLIMETDRGVATYFAPAEPSGFNKDFPVGTIICSYLNWTQFQAASKNNLNSPSGSKIWTSRYSKWAPADGRDVPNSGFEKVASRNNIPDLRGQFLRGLNQFDDEQTSVVLPNKKDPDNRTRGDFQDDEIKSHSHKTLGQYQQFSLSGPGSMMELVYGTGVHTTDATGGLESRPKNTAIFYYIRIN